MKKKLLSAAITAVLLTAGAAQAAGPAIASGTTKVYLSGASASLNYIKQMITASAGLPADKRICDSTKPIYMFNGTAGGTNQNAFYCSKDTANPSLANAGNTLLIYKRSEGGSVMGVTPVAKGDTIGFLNVEQATCTVPTAAVPAATKSANGTMGIVTCPYVSGTAANTTLAIPDFGMSDVDPIQFRGDNAEAGVSISPADVANLTVSGASAVVFGEPVTLNLYKALQAAQLSTGQIPATVPGTATACVVGDNTHEACMPSLTSAQIASIHNGAWSSWNNLLVGSTGLGLVDWVAANAPSYSPAADAVHVCRRVQGSGTQAQHGIVFLNNPCADAGLSPQGDITHNEADFSMMAHEMSESGGVTECLYDLDTGTNAASRLIGSKTVATTAFANTYVGKRWAVGIQSLEKADTNFEFVKIDGVAPTLAHVVDGSYHDWVENTFQVNTNRVLASDVSALVSTIIATAGIPEVMGALNNGFVHAFGNGSYLAVPSLYPVDAALNGAVDTAKPVNPYSRGTAGASVENCRVPTVYGGGVVKL